MTKEKKEKDADPFKDMGEADLRAAAKVLREEKSKYDTIIDEASQKRAIVADKLRAVTNRIVTIELNK